jgi:hypothetical protein
MRSNCNSYLPRAVSAPNSLADKVPIADQPWLAHHPSYDGSCSIMGIKGRGKSARQIARERWTPFGHNTDHFQRTGAVHRIHGVLWNIGLEHKDLCAESRTPSFEFAFFV